MLYLFGPKETDFVNGDSDLIHNTYDAVVDRSKGFYLKFKIALDKDERYKNIKKEMIISAHTPDGWNQFRVFDIYNHTNHVEVVATQLHYDLNYKKVFPFVVNKTTAQTALNVFVENFKSDLPNFKFTSNIKDVHSFSTDDDLERLDEGHNALEILNRIASRWGGELQVDGYNVHLVSKLGKFTNALLYEHKNISEFVDETSMTEIVTRIHAVSRFRPEREEGASEEPKEVTIKVVVDSPLINEYAQVYEEDFTYNDARTRDQLIAWARLKYTTNNVDKPTRSIKVETNIIDGQEINYGDDLVLKYTKHDVDEIIRCVGYQYNPISRQYISVTLGSNINSMASTITGAVHDSTKNQLSNIEKQVQIIKYASNNVNRVTTGPLPIPDPIEGDMWYYHPEGRPNEVELRIFQDGGWVTIVSDMTGENVRRAIAELETEAEGLAADIVASDQKATAAKEEAGLAKSATEALDLITKETAGKMVDVEQIAADAKTNASNALADASKAKTDATDALAKARESATNSSGALALAGQAATDAQTAIDNANTALSTAGSADSKAGQAIAKADAIPTTINDIITDKNLVNGSYVDTKVNNATGAWSQELVRVEGNIPTYIGGRNLIRNSNFSEGREHWFINGTASVKDTDMGKAMLLTDAGTQGFYTQPQNLENNKLYTISFLAKSNSETLNSGVYLGFLNEPSGKRIALEIDTRWKRYEYTTTIPLYSTTGYFHFYSYSETGSHGVYITDLKLEKGSIATDWTPAPEDLYTQEEFKIFNAQYTQDVNGMTGRLTTVENGKLDGSTFQTFKQSEYQVTADKVASTVERVDTAEGLITTQGTAISQNATAIASKADKTVVDTLSGTVTTQGTAISQNATDIASKASQTEVDTVKGTVSSHTTTLSQHATAISSKAEQTEVDTVKGTVSINTSTLSQHAKDISARLTSTQVNSLVNDKGYSTVSYVDTQMSATAGAIRTEMTAVEGKIPTYVGGRNLIRNSNFNEGLTHWSINGTASVTVTDMGNAMLLVDSNTQGFYTQPQNLEVGSVYTISFFAKSNSDTLDSEIYFGFLNQNSGRSTSIPIDTSWKRYRYTTDKVLGSGGSLFHFYGIKGTGTHGVLVTDIKLEKGSVATDWSPAPEDVLNQSDFNTFKASYEQSAEGWSTKLTQIEQADYASKTWSNQTFATPQSVNTQLQSYAKTTDLNGLATESYVGTQISTTAGAIRTEMTAVENKIPTEIGGRNLVVRHNEHKNSGLAGAGAYPGTSTVVYPNPAPMSGSSTMVEAIPVTAGEKITFSKSGNDFWRNNWLDENYEFISRRAHSGTYTDTVPYGAHYLWVSYPNSEQVKVERGSIRTDWTPAPEDMMQQNDFNSFKAEYEQSAQGWSSKLLQIEQADYATKTWSNQTFATPQSVTTQLSSYAKSTDLNGMVTETTLATKNFITASAVNTLLTSYAKTTALNGMVTETTLANKNYATASSVTTQLQSYAKTTDLNGLATESYVGSQLSATAGTIRSEITAVENKIPTEIGGRNLFRNSNFTNGSAHWSINGSASVKDTDMGKAMLLTDVGTGGFYTRPVHLEVNELYTISFLAKSNSATLDSGIYFGFLNEMSGKATSLIIGTSWKRYVYTTTKPLLSSNQLFHFYKASNTGTHGLHITDIKIEKGTIPTDWTPAPEDMATSQQVSSIEQKADSIQALVGTTNDSVARAVMTSSLWETEVSKVIDDELEQEYKTVTSRIDNVPRNDGLNYGTDTSTYRYYDYPLESTIVYGTKINVKFILQGTTNTGQQVAIDHVNRSGDLTMVYSTNLTAGESTASFTFDATQSLLSSGSKIRLKIYGYKSYAAYFEMWYTKDHQVPIDGTNTGAISSKITQLYNMINLSVLGKEGALSRIAIGEDGIQIDGKLLHITAKTFIDNAVIKSAMIDTLDAAKITTGTLNAANVKVINLDANSISGNEASFIQAMFTARNSALQITGTGITVSRSNGTRSFSVDSTGVNFYSDTGPGAYISTHNIRNWTGSSWVDTGRNSVMFGSELNHSIGIGYKYYENGQYVTRSAIRLHRTGSGTPELQVDLPIKNIEYQNGTVSGEYGTYFRNTQKTAGIWMGNNGKLCLITYGKLYNSTSWLNP